VHPLPTVKVIGGTSHAVHKYKVAPPPPPPPPNRVQRTLPALPQTAWPTPHDAQVHMLGVRYTHVDFGAGKSVVLAKR